MKAVRLLFSSVLICAFFMGCSDKVNKVSQDADKYKDIHEDLNKSQAYQTSVDYKTQIGDSLRNKINEFEKHFDVEIKYVAKDCLMRSLKEEQVIKSFDYLIQNLKYPKFSKQKNIVLGCGVTDLGSFSRPGYYGQESEFNHIWIREFYDKYVSNDSLITDNSYDPYAEPIIQSYIKANIATINSGFVKDVLLADIKLLDLGCKVYTYKKIGTYDYAGLSGFLEGNKGQLFLDYSIPALSDTREVNDYVFAVTTADKKQVQYKIGDSGISFQILLDNSKPAVLGNVLTRLNYVSCTTESFEFGIRLEKYKINANGKMVSIDEQKISYDYDGKLKNKVESEPINPPDNFVALSNTVSVSNRLLPDENFDFDSRFNPGSTVRVGILDSGLDYNHPSLFWRTLRNAGLLVGFDGYDSANNLPYDHMGHGTHVAGIALKGSKNLALVPLRMNIFNDEDTFLELVDSAAKTNIKVINVSLGWFSKTQADKIFGGLIKGIKKYPDIIFVLAAGNESANLNVTPLMPACLNTDNVIVVAALDNKNEPAYFSNYGNNCVDVAAPGVDILSSFPGKDSSKPALEKMSGTSMAAPFVTNIVAKMLTINPNLKPKQVKDILMESSFKADNLKSLIKAGGYVFPEATYRRVKNGN